MKSVTDDLTQAIDSGYSLLYDGTLPCQNAA